MDEPIAESAEVRRGKIDDTFTRVNTIIMEAGYLPLLTLFDTGISDKITVATSINEAIVGSPGTLFTLFLVAYGAFCIEAGIGPEEALPNFITALQAAYQTAISELDAVNH